MRHYYYQFQIGKRTIQSQLYHGRNIARERALAKSAELGSPVTFCETDGFGHVHRTSIAKVKVPVACTCANC